MRSVTEVLKVINKGGLVSWANKQGLKGVDTAKALEAAASVGTETHAMIEAHLKGEKQKPASPKAMVCFRKYLDWHEKNKPQLIASEIALVSERYQYGGCLDALLSINGRTCLMDWKTSKRPYPDHGYQIAAYGRLLEESGRRVEEYRVLALGPGQPEPLEMSIGWHEIEPYWDVFRTALDLHALIRGIENASSQNH